MKKIYSLIIVAVAALTFACCGNANKKAAAETEATETTVETVVEECDSTKCCGECCEGDSTAAAETEAAEVVEEATK